jgi:putative SOS response-associated peptidase YedK
MCGRFTISFVIGLYERFNVKTHSVQIIPRYNIAPSQDAPVVIRVHRDGDENEIHVMKWGLIPSWSKDPSRSPKPINARGDTLEQKPMFRDLLRYKRCLVPATGSTNGRKNSGVRPPITSG